MGALLVSLGLAIGLSWTIGAASVGAASARPQVSPGATPVQVQSPLGAPTTVIPVTGGLAPAEIVADSATPRRAFPVAPLVVAGPTFAIAADVRGKAVASVGPTAAATASVVVTVRETAGRPAFLAPPAVLPLTRQDGANLVQVHTGPATTQFGAGPPTGKPGAGGAVALGPYATTALSITIPGIPGPGQYQGVVRLPQGLAPPVDQAFTILVKGTWCWTATLIFLGVAMSWLFRHYLQAGQASAQVQRRAAQLGSDVSRAVEATTSLRSQTRPVVENLRRELAQQSALAPYRSPRYLPRSRHLGLRARNLDDLGARVGLLGPWLAATSAAAAKPDPEVETNLETVRRYLLGTTPPAPPAKEPVPALPAKEPAPVPPAKEPSPAPPAKEAGPAPSPEEAAQALARAERALAQPTTAPTTGIVGGETPSGAGRPSLEGVLRRMRFGSLLVHVLLLAVAVLLGLQILWIGNSAWGSDSDLVLAFFWGLGLHVAGSTAAFGGLASLQASLAGQPAPGNGAGSASGAPA